MFNAKRSMIDAVMIAKDVVNTVNKDRENEKGYISYLTSMGWITGKEFETLEIDSSSEEKLANELERLQKEGKEIDAISLAVSMYEHWANKYEKNTGNKVNESSNAIFLDDVTIKSHDGSVINTNVFVLFSDQVLGILPAKII